MKILGTYRITYDNGISQEKTLISHSDYEDIIKPKLMAIHGLECLKENKEENSTLIA